MSKGDETNLRFKDLEKAYNPVPRCKHFKEPNDFEAFHELINIVRELYRNNKA